MASLKVGGSGDCPILVSAFKLLFPKALYPSAPSEPTVTPPDSAERHGEPGGLWGKGLCGQLV